MLRLGNKIRELHLSVRYVIAMIRVLYEADQLLEGLMIFLRVCWTNDIVYQLSQHCTSMKHILSLIIP